MFLRTITVALAASTFAVSLCADGALSTNRKVSMRMARATIPRLSETHAVTDPDVAELALAEPRELLAVLKTVELDDDLDMDGENESTNFSAADILADPLPKSTVPEPIGLVAIALGLAGFVRIRKR